MAEVALYIEGYCDEGLGYIFSTVGISANGKFRLLLFLISGEMRKRLSIVSFIGILAYTQFHL